MKAPDLTRGELGLVRSCLKQAQSEAAWYGRSLNPRLGDNAAIIARYNRRVRKIKDLLTQHFMLPEKS